MAQRTDGWALMARIVAQPECFGSCDTTVGLAALLMLRNELVQGVSSEAALVALADVVGEEPMVEVIGNLAAYEALRIVANIGGAEPAGDKPAPDAARKRLVDIVTHKPAETEAPADTLPVSAEPARVLRRHRAMGARRIRPSR